MQDSESTNSSKDSIGLSGSIASNVTVTSDNRLAADNSQAQTAEVKNYENLRRWVFRLIFFSAAASLVVCLAWLNYTKPPVYKPVTPGTNVATLTASANGATIVVATFKDSLINVFVSHDTGNHFRLIDSLRYVLAIGRPYPINAEARNLNIVVDSSGEHAILAVTISNLHSTLKTEIRQYSLTRPYSNTIKTIKSFRMWGLTYVPEKRNIFFYGSEIDTLSQLTLNTNMGNNAAIFKQAFGYSNLDTTLAVSRVKIKVTTTNDENFPFKIFNALKYNRFTHRFLLRSSGIVPIPDFGGEDLGALAFDTSKVYNYDDDLIYADSLGWMAYPILIDTNKADSLKRVVMMKVNDAGEMKRLYKWSSKVKDRNELLYASGDTVVIFQRSESVTHTVLPADRRLDTIAHITHMDHLSYINAKLMLATAWDGGNHIFLAGYINDHWKILPVFYTTEERTNILEQKWILVLATMLEASIVAITVLLFMLRRRRKEMKKLTDRTKDILEVLNDQPLKYKPVDE